MSTTPNLLDQVDAENQQAVSAPQTQSSTPASQLAPSSGNLLDQVDAEYQQQQSVPPVETDSRKTGEQVNDIGKTVIVPKEGESFADTMKRAAAQGKKTTQQDVNDEVATAPKKVAEVLAAAPVIGAAGAAGLAAPGEAVSGIRAFPSAAEAVLDHAETFAKAIAEKYPTLVSAAGKMGVPTSVIGTLIYLYEHAKPTK